MTLKLAPIYEKKLFFLDLGQDYNYSKNRMMSL